MIARKSLDSDLISPKLRREPDINKIDIKKEYKSSKSIIGPSMAKLRMNQVGY